VNKLEDLDEVELGKLMKACALSIEQVFRYVELERPLFTLLIWNDPKIAQYICNCPRTTAIEAIRETADRLAARDDVTREDFPDDG
jgi:hypothetical protein